MEDQSYDGGVWNRQAFALLQEFGWERIGDRDMDVLGDDDSKMGVDTIVTYSSPIKTRPQIAILEAKHYLTTSFSKSNLEDWLSRLDTKLTKLKNSETFKERFPKVDECTVLNTGIIAIWFHNTDAYEEFNPKFKEILRQITVSGRQRKAGTSNIFVIDNERFVRMFALHEELNHIKHTEGSQFNFIYSQTFTSGNPVKRIPVLSIEAIFSDVIFGEATKQDGSKISHIFYFGENNFKSMQTVKSVFSKTVNFTTDLPIVLHVFNADSEFRKIEDDIKNTIFDGFNLSIRRMGKNSNLPTFILNIDNNE